MAILAEAKETRTGPNKVANNVMANRSDRDHQVCVAGGLTDSWHTPPQVRQISRLLTKDSRREAVAAVM